MMVLLAACGIDASATSMPPTIEATMTPSKTVTKTSTPAATMDPTFAYWATAQEATFSAESDQSDATQQAIFDLSAQFPQLCGFDREGISISPGGEWIANDCRLIEGVFRVFRTSGAQVWDVPYSAVMKYYPESIGSVRTLHWAPNGNAVYFTSSSCCADTGAITNGDALYRLNLQTGERTRITEAPFSYYSFSPDGRRLIYLANNQPNANDFLRLHLLDLRSEKEDFIDIAGFGQGWMDWKGDGQKIALFAQTGSIYGEMQFSLVIVDLMDKSQQPVILNAEERLDITDWSNDDILTIRRSNLMEYNDYQVNVFETIFYDLKKNSFVTPTPTP
jgi:dipeptidyl aminopeptidase/acylaminoacyl peptidase